MDGLQGMFDAEGAGQHRMRCSSETFRVRARITRLDSDIRTNTGISIRDQFEHVQCRGGRRRSLPGSFERLGEAQSQLLLRIGEQLLPHDRERRERRAQTGRVPTRIHHGPARSGDGGALHGPHHDQQLGGGPWHLPPTPAPTGRSLLDGRPDRGVLRERSALEHHGHDGGRLLDGTAAAEQGDQVRRVAGDMVAHTGEDRTAQRCAQQGESVLGGGGDVSEPLHEDPRLAVALRVVEIVDPTGGLPGVARARQRQLSRPQRSPESIQIRQAAPTRPMRPGPGGGGAGGHHSRNLPSVHLSAHGQFRSVQ